MKSTEYFKIDSLFNHADLLVRAGRIAEARALLSKIKKPMRLPSAVLPKFAGLLRRCGNSLDALKVLARQLKDDRIPTKANQELWLEYAACVNSLNGVVTAQRILAFPALAGATKTHLYKAFNHIHKWEYEVAEIELRSFLKKIPDADYDYWVARVNLIDCLVALNRETNAQLQLDKILPQLRSRNYWRLLFNALVLQLKIHVIQGNSTAANSVLRAIRTLSLRGMGTFDELVLKKWKAIFLLEKHGSRGLRALRAVRSQCKDNSHSEIARDLDYRIAKATSNEALLQFVWFGSPSAGFRQSLEVQPSKQTKVQLDGSALSIYPSLAPEKNLDLPNKNTPTLVERLYLALLVDFYRKPNIVELFERIYPEANFNPFTSSLIVRQLIHRLRTYLQNEKISLSIDQMDGLYSLHVKSPTMISFSSPPWNQMEKSPLELELFRAVEKTGTRFTAHEFSNALATPLRNSQLLLKKMQEEGLITHHRKTRGSYYEIQKNLR